MSSVPKPLPWQEGRRAIRYKYHWPSGFARRSSHKAVSSGRSEKVPTSSLPSRHAHTRSNRMSCPILSGSQGCSHWQNPLLMQLDCHLIEKPGNGHSIRQKCFLDRKFHRVPLWQKAYFGDFILSYKKKLWYNNRKTDAVQRGSQSFFRRSPKAAKRLWAL